MDSLIPLRGATEPALSQAQARAANWRPGSLLQAVVLDASQAGRVQLQIGPHVLFARTVIPLSEGQVLDLKVTHNGELIVVERQPHASTGGARSLAESDVARQAMRQALPRQTGQAPLLANLAQAARNLEARLPPALVQAARQALEQLPDVQAVVRPHGLRRAVQDSGLFLESRLAAGARGAAVSSPAPDWKATLLRLVANLRALTTVKSSVEPTSPPASSRAPAAGGNVHHDAGARAHAPASSSLSSSSSAAGASSPGPPVPRGESANPLRAGSSPSPGPTPPRGPSTILPSGPGGHVTPSSPGASAGAGAGAAPSRATAPDHSAPTGSDGGQVTRSGPAAGGENAARIAPREIAPPLRDGRPEPQARATPSLPTSPDAVAGKLLQQLDGALARLTLSQLASLPGEELAKVWLFELPVRTEDGQHDLWHFRFEREHRGGEDAELAPWSVSIAFDFAELGPVRVQITLRGETVSSVFWAQRKGTAERLRGALDRLQGMLERRGLEVGCLGCRAGHPDGGPVTASNVLEERA